MRTGLQLAIGVAFTVAVAGCTLLVSFDDIPDAGSGLTTNSSSGNSSSGDGDESSSSSSGSTPTSSSSSSTSSSSSSSSGTTTPDAGTTFPPACDTTVNLAGIDCNGNTHAVCGTEVQGTTNVSDDDLVTCNGAGTATCVQHCTEGCADLSNLESGALPSQCANCTKGAVVADNWYCGKDTDWTSADHDIAYECVNGRLNKASPVTCGTNLCHTECTRTSPPPLPGSCCQSTPDN